jgi:hypothetical protein
VYRRHNRGRHFSLDLTAGRVVDAIQTTQAIWKSSTSILPVPASAPEEQRLRQQSGTAPAISDQRPSSAAAFGVGDPRRQAEAVSN